MIYEVKNILKSRFSIVCFILLFLINIIGAMNVLNGIEHQSNQQMYTLTASTILQKKDLLKANQNTYKNQINVLSKEDNDNWKNYLCYNEWEIYANEQIRDYYKNDMTDQIEFNELNFLLTLAEMSMYSNDEENDFNYDGVFKEDKSYIEKLFHKHHVTFDMKKLGVMNTGFANEEKHVYYSDRLKRSEDNLSRLKTRNKQLFLGSNSPWSYLLNQLDDDSLFSFVVFPLGTVFGVVSVISSYKTRSKYLLAVRPKSKFKIAIREITAIFVSYVCIVLVSLLLPMVIIGIKFGWQGIHSTILADMQGYKSLTGYEFDPSLKAGYGLSVYYGVPASMLLVKGVFISERLVFIPMLLALGLSSVMLLLMVYLFVLIGYMIASFIKNRVIKLLLSTFLFAFYFISQFVDVMKVPFNLFSYSSCMRMALGGMQASQMMVLIVVVSTLIILLLTVFVISKKKISYD